MNATSSTFKSLVVLSLAALVLGGCARKVMPTPRIYASGQEPAFETLDPSLESTNVDLFYVTDREDESEDPDNPEYGYGRSPSVAYGSAVVAIGKGNTWEEIRDYSTGDNPRLRPRLALVETIPKKRLPATPYLFQIVDGTDIELDPEIVAEREQAIAEFSDEIRSRLALTPRKEVFVFVHGVGNGFDDATETAAQLWHFLGREGVPIAYTWPAGSGGLFFYAYDRESSEFTIFHFKQFMKILASIEEIEKVHLIAHSRGTGVSLAGMRELVLEARAAGTNPREYFKLENVVLIAPDLDFDVTMQRDVAEGLGTATTRMTMYASTDDSAMEAARGLFNSRMRLGSTQPEELTEEQRETLRRQHNLDIVIYKGQQGGSFGHSYAVSNPAVSSDVIALLRFNRAPGKENGRPLIPLGDSFWLLTDQYMQ